MHYEISVDIAAAPEAVWAVMADVERWPSWTASVTSVELLGDGPPLHIGSRVRIKQPGFPSAVWTVTDLERGLGFTWANKAPGMISTGDHRVSPNGRGGAVAVLRISQTGPLSFLARALAARTRRYVRTEAEGLRRASEGQTRPSARGGAKGGTR